MMKTVIQVKDKTRCKKRESLIREALKHGFKPKRVSDQVAMGMTEHFINPESSGSKLQRI